VESNQLRNPAAKGIDFSVRIGRPDLVEAGHYKSLKLVSKTGETEILVLSSSYKNRVLSATIEHRAKGGSVLESGEVLDIGAGFAVDAELAKDWVKAKYITAEIYEKARRLSF
jgi:hypothetical protein